MNWNVILVFLGGVVVQESTCQCRRCRKHGFNPWVRKINMEEEMATCSSILAWKIPWTVEPGRLQSTESQRVGHDWTLSIHIPGNTHLPALQTFLPLFWFFSLRFPFLLQKLFSNLLCARNCSWICEHKVKHKVKQKKFLSHIKVKRSGNRTVL